MEEEEDSSQLLSYLIIHMSPIFALRPLSFRRQDIVMCLCRGDDAYLGLRGVAARGVETGAIEGGGAQ